MKEEIIVKSEHYDAKKIAKTVGWSLALLTFVVLTIIFGNDWYFSFVAFYPRHFCVKLVCMLGGLLIGLLIYWWMRSYALTVTEKRISGYSAFGKRVDLPIDAVSAIGLGWGKSIKVTTASGVIGFMLIKNRDVMYKTIGDLIANRQGKHIEQTIVTQEIRQSNADELKKYKELLNEGIITQAEFDEKKKQLLGL